MKKNNIENRPKTSLIHIVDGPDSLKAKYNSDYVPASKKVSVEEEPKEEKKETKESVFSYSLKKKLLVATAVLASLTLIIVIVNEIFYQVARQKTLKKLAELQNEVLIAVEAKNQLISGQPAKPTPEIVDTTDVEIPTAPTEPVLLPEYEKLYFRNSDMVGWIKIDDTEINYPVMQTKSDNEFYLRRDFDKKDDKNGLPFVDYQSDVFKPTTNVLIYGHSMNSGLMFAALLKYKDEAFFKKHPVIRFDTLYEHAEYEIVAAFRSRVAYVDEVTFRYYTFFDTDSEKEFNDYISNVKQLSYYDTGVKAEFGDKLLTLSTCDKSIQDGRMVIVARKIKTQ